MFLYRKIIALTLLTALCNGYAHTVLKTGKDAGTVRTEIFGNNQLHYGDGYGVVDRQGVLNPEMIALLQEAGMTIQRYPGGCSTHFFNWKQAVGPNRRKYTAFALPEFLAFCERSAVNAVITVSAFTGKAEDGADLVAYLNLPANGGDSMAALRADDGHPAPYGIKYFEYGNEVYHGTTCRRSLKHHRFITPEQYAENYLAYRTAMKHVDPEIKLGVVMYSPLSKYKDSADWNNRVLAKLKGNYDFLIIHLYCHDPLTSGKTIAAWDFFLSARYITSSALKNILKQAEQHGKKNPPLAVTEFNSNIAIHSTLLSALVCAQTYHAMLYTPEVFMANFWQFANEGWGMIRNYKKPYLRRPSFLMLKLFRKYLYTRLLEPEITTSSVTIPACPEHPVPDKQELERDLISGRELKIEQNGEFAVLKHPGDVVEIKFLNDRAWNFFHVSYRQPIAADPFYGYRLTAEVRSEGMEESSGPQIQLGDTRGWTQTRSAASTPPVRPAEWTKVEAEYIPRADTDSLTITFRRISGGGKGRMFFRNLRLSRFLRQREQLPLIEATVSQTNDGKKHAFLLLNRSNRPEKTVIEYTAARRVIAETLTGPSPLADNESNPGNIRIIQLPVRNDGRSLTIVLPPWSLTGIRAEQ